MKNIKRILSAILMVCMLLGDFTIFAAETASAATTTQDHGFEIDENLFDITWYEGDKIWVKQTCRKLDPDFDKGKKLGYAVVNIGFATSYKSIDGKIYQRILVDSKMVPQTVKGNKQGMSQLLNIKIANNEELCKNLTIQPASTSGSTSYSTNGATLGLGLDVSKEKNGALTFGGGADFTMGIKASTSYTTGSLVITTNEDNSNYGIWNYDYKASNKNAAQNAYLLGSSTQDGLYMWNTPDTKYLVDTLDVKVSVTFGGGNSSTYKVYKNNGTSNHLGSKSTSFTIKSYNNNTNYAGK